MTVIKMVTITAERSLIIMLVYIRLPLGTLSAEREQQMSSLASLMVQLMQAKF